MTISPDSPTIAIVNDPSSQVDDLELSGIVDALQVQIDRDFGPLWGQRADLRFNPSRIKPPAGTWQVAVLGTSDQAGALGYHDLTPDGLPLGKVFAVTDRQYGESLSVTLSHEVLEMISDPWINLCAQADDGRFYAWENCDAVEADSLGYRIHGVQVSDFVTPAWFGHGGLRYDFVGHCKRPFDVTPGGYVSVFDPSNAQGWTQVQARGLGLTAAAVVRAEMEGNTDQPIFDARPSAYQMIARVGSRRERRFRGARNWVVSSYELA